MSQVELTRSNTDVVNVSIESTGESEIAAFFKLPILDESKSYVVGCTSLAVPMMATRMFDNSVRLLLSIRRRNVGALITTADQVALNGGGFAAGSSGAPVGGANLALLTRQTMGPLVSDLDIEQKWPMHNLSDFLAVLNSYAAGFTRRAFLVGVDPVFYGGPQAGGAPGLATGWAAGAAPEQLLNFGISAGGTLLITGQPAFWNHFYISVSDMGQKLLALPGPLIAATTNQAVQQTTFFGEGLTDAANLILPATVNQAHVVFGSKSLLSTTDGRVSVHLESDLSIGKVISIENNQEGSNYDLCSFVLENTALSTLHVDGLNIANQTSFQSNCHTGQLVLQNRSDTPTQWTPLLRTDALRTLRLRLYLKTRRYDVASGKFVLEKSKFPMEPSDNFTCDLRFVSIQ